MLYACVHDKHTDACMEAFVCVCVQGGHMQAFVYAQGGVCTWWSHVLRESVHSYMHITINYFCIIHAFMYLFKKTTSRRDRLEQFGRRDTASRRKCMDACIHMDMQTCIQTSIGCEHHVVRSYIHTHM